MRRYSDSIARGASALVLAAVVKATAAKIPCSRRLSDAKDKVPSPAASPSSAGGSFRPARESS